jgi:uncharacterized protein YdiU (UPF0061 family)
MAKANPNLIPRNHQVELAIKEALNADFTLFYRLNEAFKSPYEKTCRVRRFRNNTDGRGRSYKNVLWDLDLAFLIK